MSDKLKYDLSLPEWVEQEQQAELTRLREENKRLQAGWTCAVTETQRLQGIEQENERLQHAKDDAERSLSDAIGRCVAAQEENERLREWLNDALTVLEAPGASSNEQKRELAHAMRAALRGEGEKS